MNKQKTPLELISYFKNKEAKKEDGSDMNDSEKRKAALDKVRSYKKQKNNKSEK